MKFLGLGLEDRIPDSTTVWSFRERLTEAGLIIQLFENFEEYLKKEGFEAKEGQIVDSTWVPSLKQHNQSKENKMIKIGEIPKEWEEKPRHLVQKDIDAH